ncbi:hypothetical protein Hdeb2414_s0002g00069411 [Helianthus debilis subsp. tardiflorus]
MFSCSRLFKFCTWLYDGMLLGLFLEDCVLKGIRSMRVAFQPSGTIYVLSLGL